METEEEEPKTVNAEADDSPKTVRRSCGCSGCVSTIILLIILWALCFGVTVNGKHYELSCGCSQGVTFAE